MVAIQNAISGELETAKVTMIVQRDTPKYKAEPFTILFQAATLVMSRHITPSTSKILICLVGVVEYGNVIGKSNKELAELTGYSLRQVERAMKELVGYNVLIASPHPIDKRITQYHLNALQSWKGNVKDRKKRLQQTDPNQLGLFASEEKPKAMRVNKNFDNPLLELDKKSFPISGAEIK